MAFHRGFKTEAHRLAAEVRAELSLGPLDRLDPSTLLGSLAIPATRSLTSPRRSLRRSTNCRPPIRRRSRR
jgi:hypothetical protein